MHSHVKIIFFLSGDDYIFTSNVRECLRQHFQCYLMAILSHTLRVLVGTATASAVWIKRQYA